jgi:hypothetical protein
MSWYRFEADDSRPATGGPRVLLPTNLTERKDLQDISPRSISVACLEISFIVVYNFDVLDRVATHVPRLNNFELRIFFFCVPEYEEGKNVFKWAIFSSTTTKIIISPPVGFSFPKSFPFLLNKPCRPIV